MCAAEYFALNLDILYTSSQCVCQLCCMWFAVVSVAAAAAVVVPAASTIAQDAATIAAHIGIVFELSTLADPFHAHAAVVGTKCFHDFDIRCCAAPFLSCRLQSQ